jgi:hypothetical protein
MPPWQEWRRDARFCCGIWNTKWEVNQIVPSHNQSLEFTISGIVFVVISVAPEATNLFA